MTNIPKPDLERGNFIAYADEPGTIVDNSGGGGGVVYLELEYDAESTPSPYIPHFSYNDVKTNVEAGKIVCIRAIYTNAGTDIIEVHQVTTISRFSDPVEYVVFTELPRFTATDPDEPMTNDSELG